MGNWCLGAGGSGSYFDQSPFYFCTMQLLVLYKKGKNETFKYRLYMTDSKLKDTKNIGPN